MYEVTVKENICKAPIGDNEWSGWSVFVDGQELAWHSEQERAEEHAEQVRVEVETGNDPFGTYCEECRVQTRWEWQDVDWDVYDTEEWSGVVGTCTVCGVTYFSYCGTEQCCPFVQVQDSSESEALVQAQLAEYERKGL